MIEIVARNVSDIKINGTKVSHSIEIISVKFVSLSMNCGFFLLFLTSTHVVWKKIRQFHNVNHVTIIFN